MSSEDFLKENPEDAKNALASLLHYDPKNGFLNSPMAKTLNLAFFPFRFNVKVSTYMAKFLAKQDPMVQYAAVMGIMNAHNFLNSAQGMAWYSNNSDAIGLFSYFSPVETISTIASALGLKHDSVMQYGELGGLPFGWIPQMLDSVGLTHFGQAYVNPKTGVIAKDYIPTNMYGKLNAALGDLLQSLFTYPGATAGLPSKGSVARRITGGILSGSQNDFDAVDPTNITPQEAEFSKVVSGMNGNVTLTPEQISQLPKRPTSQSVDMSGAVQMPTPVYKAKTSTKSKLKKQYDPNLTPEQRQLLGL